MVYLNLYIRDIYKEYKEYCFQADVLSSANSLSSYFERNKFKAFLAFPKIFEIV